MNTLAVGRADSSESHTRRVINFPRAEPYSCADEDARRLVALADQAAIAIHNGQSQKQSGGIG